MDEPVIEPGRNNAGTAVEYSNGETISATATLNELQAPPEPTPQEELSPFSKPCDICQRRRDVLIRCQTDDTGKWRFVCTGKCWIEVSGGNKDGDRSHPFYKYGGTWKNKHEYVSGKIKGKAKAKGQELSGGFKGPHRRHGHWRPKTKKTMGEVEIGDDDGGSDIEVSDISDDMEGLGDADGRHLEESHIQVKRADQI
jgi:hypothetical protein